MKVFALFIFLVAVPFKQAQAQAYGMAGCGLGSMLLGEKRGMMQVIAGTSNFSFLSQTFGISTGTSNCTDGSGRLAETFVKVNKEALMTDISRGQGETIDSLEVLYGCEGRIGSVLKQNYRKIFDQKTSSGIDSKMRSILKENNVLCEQQS